MYKRKIPFVRLVKNIPLCSGLGGGSSDAACFLYTVLHDIWNINIDEIIDIAKDSHVLGMDVPVFMHRLIHGGNLLFLDGIGKFEEIQQLEGDLKENLEIGKDIFMLVVNNGKTKLHTKTVFSKWRGNYVPRQSASYLLNNIQHCQNSLLETAVAMKPGIQKILDDIDLSGAVFSRMSGSGSSCFGLYNNLESLEIAKCILKRKYRIVVGNY
ncbi:MAG: hypothetical protein LBG13_02715 [Holosporales bacterium]|jgi:4-diphosphocytidyl-2-C-methyl-D-erythritol kinase|nr:hypothetical protein [Holosporales bacterium]